MPNGLLILTQNPGIYNNTRLAQEAKNLGLTCQFLNVYDSFLPCPNPSSLALKARSWQEFIVMHRQSGRIDDQFDILFSKYLQTQQVKISNPPEALEQLKNKEFQTLFFAQHGLPTVPTFSLRGKIGLEVLSQQISHWRCDRFIVKTVLGQKGIGVTLVNGEESLVSLLSTLQAIGDQRFLIQPFIEDSREVRFFMIKNRPLVVFEKLRKSGFKNNLAYSEIKQVPADLLSCDLFMAMQKIVDKILSVVKLDYCAIDFIFSNHKEALLYLLEVNLSPGFEGPEQHFGINMARSILQTIADTK